MWRNDPRWLKARYKGQCKRCGKDIKPGDNIYYYPLGKVCYCDADKCGKACEADFRSKACDEDVYNGVGNPYAN